MRDARRDCSAGPLRGEHTFQPVGDRNRTDGQVRVPAVCDHQRRLRFRSNFDIHPHLHAVALDFSDAMIQRLEKRFATDPSVGVVRHDLDAPLPALDGPFDAVVSSFAIHHLARGVSGEPYDVARLLLDRGADPSIRDSKNDGDALGWAQSFKRAEIVQILEDHTANRSA